MATRVESNVAPGRPGTAADEVADVGALSDGALLVGVARGERDALALLFRRHGADVHALARLVCGPGPAEQVVHDVFLRVWQRPEDFAGGSGAFRSTLRAVAHAQAVELCRSQRAGRRADAPAVLPAAVDDVMAALPEPERQPIALAYVGGHTCREVAALLGVPEATIRSRIRAGLARLRPDLGSAAQPPVGPATS